MNKTYSSLKEGIVMRRKMRSVGKCFYEKGKAWVAEVKDGEVVLVRHPRLDAKRRGRNR